MNSPKPRCPRCHSCMLLDYTDTVEGLQRTWKCMGCGREIFADQARQTEDDRLLAQIREAGTAGGPSSR
jgi:transposase-like protein